MLELSLLSDEVLLENTRTCARSEREKTAVLVAHLAEVFRRDLALKRGYSSLYRYAREELQLTEAMAWERVNAARLSLQMPETIDRLSRGELTLASAGELFKTFREIEKPKKQIEVPKAQPDLTWQTEALPAAPPAPQLDLAEKRDLLAQVLGKTRNESAQKAERAGTIAPPKAKHERMFKLTDDELTQFDRLRDLLSHKLGTRDPQDVFLWLLKQGLEKVDPVLKEQRTQTRSRPTPDAQTLADQETPRLKRKTLPAALKRRVWIRDHGCCQHTDPRTGRKCENSAFLDYDHRVPLSQGGSDEEANIVLSCASHNRRKPLWDEADQPV